MTRKETPEAVSQYVAIRLSAYRPCRQAKVRVGGIGGGLTPIDKIYI